jgi:uncharacterized membrane protein YbhN (UPF0104 family)
LGSEAPARKRRWLKAAKLLFRLLILALVAYGIWRSVVKGRADLARQHFSWSQINPWWLVVSALAYFVGTLPSWLFWHRTLWAMGQRPTRYEALRAFFIGHLGKYVPGKALVPVLRAGLVRGPRVDTTVAVTAVFVETLTSMAVGGLVAAATTAILFHDQPRLLLLALGLMVVIGVPSLPPVFRRVVLLLGVRKINPDIDRALAGLDYRLLLYGWTRIVPGWFLFGFSLWAALKSIPATAAIGLQDWPFTTVCQSLAVLAGFITMVPGGLGPREWVIMTVLAGTYGEGAAVVSAVLVRLASLAAEGVFSAMLYLIRPRGDGPARDTTNGAQERDCRTPVNGREVP